MENIPLPSKVAIKNTAPNEALITVEPCYPGYGMTIGNALRRVLLSSLPGSAIVAVKITGATHEFSTLSHIKEDVVELILNLKKIRFKLHGVGETKLSLKIKGEKVVTAKDIKATSEVEIINSEAHIATLTDKSADLEMELFIDSGRGYLPVESMEKNKLELGVIAIDAIFTPIKNVNFNVENVRVGQITNYDKLTLGIKTDGTIKPIEAYKFAADILLDHFKFITGNVTEEKKIKEIKIEKVEKTVKVEKQVEEEEKPKKKRGRPPKKEK